MYKSKILIAVIALALVGCGGSGTSPLVVIDSRMNSWLDSYQRLDDQRVGELTAADFTDYANGTTQTREQTMQFLRDRKAAGFRLAVTVRRTYGSQIPSGSEAYGFIDCKLIWTPPGGIADPPETHTFLFNLRHGVNWEVTRRYESE